MPHKHTRKEKDLSLYDLPPTQIAKPLPVTSISKKKAPPAKKNAEDSKKVGVKRKRGDSEKNDAPRAFKRLMAFANGRPTRSGLDDGNTVKKKGKSKSGKNASNAAATAEKQADSKPDLTIRPGERLWEFSQRVDAALPLSGVATKTIKQGKDPLGLKVWRTNKERKMHKLYDEWREEDRKIKEKREEELELEEEKAMEDDAVGVTWKLDMEESAKGKKKKKGKRGKYIGEETGKEDDPWEELKKKRGEAKIGINDVAQAPPELVKLPKRLLVSGAAVEVSDIPKAAGSLRQREKLQGIRHEVVESYRKMMSEKRPLKAAVSP
ncbi:hypothetical protein QBC47DRAFT_403139 [Echria macrotheca]|uniref:Urease accessory protein n=1 Tax=Echria macrotheca TaxID=438768 RepID=A0AAJ0BCU6_9PEZI|nr:hypothetical protein QBC47DRAFT_403139 [Echria macrotheca]